MQLSEFIKLDKINSQVPLAYIKTSFRPSPKRKYLSSAKNISFMQAQSRNSSESKYSRKDFKINLSQVTKKKSTSIINPRLSDISVRQSLQSVNLLKFKNLDEEKLKLISSNSNIRSELFPSEEKKTKSLRRAASKSGKSLRSTILSNHVLGELTSRRSESISKIGVNEFNIPIVKKKENREGIL